MSVSSCHLVILSVYLSANQCAIIKINYMDDQREWRIKRGELLDRLDDEQEKRRCLKASYSSLEEWSDMFCEDFGTARRVRENREKVEDMKREAEQKGKKEKKRN